jgi:hypothetical protein
MIAGRRRRRRATIHAGLAFESLAHEPLYHVRRGVAGRALTPTGRCWVIQVRNPPWPLCRGIEDSADRIECLAILPATAMQRRIEANSPASLVLVALRCC